MEMNWRANLIGLKIDSKDKLIILIENTHSYYIHMCAIFLKGLVISFVENHSVEAIIVNFKVHTWLDRGSREKMNRVPYIIENI